MRRGGEKQVEPCIFPEDISEIVNLLCDRKGNISEGTLGSESVTPLVKHELTGSLQSPRGARIPPFCTHSDGWQEQQDYP